MAAFLDKETNKWKWGTRGLPVYDSKEQCQRNAMNDLAEMLRKIKKKLDEAKLNYGN